MCGVVAHGGGVRVCVCAVCLFKQNAALASVQCFYLHFEIACARRPFSARVPRPLTHTHIHTPTDPTAAGVCLHTHTHTHPHTCTRSRFYFPMLVRFVFFCFGVCVCECSLFDVDRRMGHGVCSSRESVPAPPEMRARQDFRRRRRRRPDRTECARRPG